MPVLVTYTVLFPDWSLLEEDEALEPLDVLGLLGVVVLGLDVVVEDEFDVEEDGLVLVVLVLFGVVDGVDDEVKVLTFWLESSEYGIASIKTPMATWLVASPALASKKHTRYF